MKLTIQKRLASEILKCSPDKIWLDSEKSKEIKEAITKIDMKNLIKQGLVAKKKLPEQSRARARFVHDQKVKGRRGGSGSKKGSPSSRLSDKEKWITKVRSLRTLLAELKEKSLISPKTYRNLYSKAKGGFFRNKRHIKLYINEHDLLIKKENGTKK
ncbi:MAG: 50S ribosomal protein L19e [Candidatus Woesearchaeota archaeon]